MERTCNKEYLRAYSKQVNTQSVCGAALSQAQYYLRHPMIKPLV